MPIRLSPKMADWRSRLSRQILVEKHSQNFKHGRFGAIAATFGVHRHFSPYSAVQAVSWGRDDGLGSNRIGMKLSIQRNSGNYASVVRNVTYKHSLPEKLQQNPSRILKSRKLLRPTNRCASINADWKLILNSIRSQMRAPNREKILVPSPKINSKK